MCIKIPLSRMGLLLGKGICLLYGAAIRFVQSIAKGHAKYTNGYTTA